MLLAQGHDLIELVFSAVFGFERDEPAPAEDQVQRWVSAAQTGDTDSARFLYRTYVAKVYRSVRPLCCDDAEAEDVTQEAFARALEALDSYAPRTNARFISWLLMIAMNVARKNHRRRRRTVNTEPQELVDAADRDNHTGDDPVGGALDERALQRALAAALDALDAREREIVTLRYGGELDAKEISGITGLEHAHVRKIAQRARDALRVEIERILGAQSTMTQGDAR